jgi:hypothetical protein
MQKALKLLDEISEHIGTCCAITMEPDEVQDLIDQLKEEIIKLEKSIKK